AAEIVAGALQDHDRAVIIGQPTYGKGSAQSVIPFGDQGGLKITTARWFTPVGRSITKVRPSDDDEEPAPVKKERFRTDAGRVVFGGGGITPDIFAGDTIAPAAETDFLRALGAQTSRFRDAITDYALNLKATHAITKPDFVVVPAMREEIWNRMRARGIDIQRSVFDEAQALVDRQLSYEIARYVFG
ncbi:MAG: S41 family peptidase, partial [Gemmatimonadaceae bacterium]